MSSAASEAPRQFTRLGSFQTLAHHRAGSRFAGQVEPYEAVVGADEDGVFTGCLDGFQWSLLCSLLSF